MRHPVGLILIGLSLILCSLGAQAHPYHESLTEIEWNATAQYWEVSIRVLPEALESALESQSGRRVNLDKTENVDELIIDYLRRVIMLKAAQSPAKAQLSWVGKEVSYKAAWLYVKVDAVPPPVLLNVRLFFEQEPEQVNHVFHLLNGRRIPYDFKPGSKAVPISINAAPIESSQ